MIITLKLTIFIQIFPGESPRAPRELGPGSAIGRRFLNCLCVRSFMHTFGNRRASTNRGSTSEQILDQEFRGLISSMFRGYIYLF